MKRRTLLANIAILPLMSSFGAHAASRVQVYKNPSCGCCAAWVEHLQAAGFSVDVTEMEDTAPIRKRYGMPERLAGCHTGVIDGYVLEGHVPAADVKRLLAAKPQAIGLVVPGMPVGSPGMEYGDRKEPYKVLVVDRKGRDSVFASYEGK